MSDEFVRVGALMDINSYPLWAQQMVHDCAEAKRRIVQHEVFHMMREGRIEHRVARNFLVFGWPVIEQFPQYMALNLRKIQYGRNRGQDMARKYLIHNIRVEQNHADHWVAWAAASGVGREDLLYGPVHPEAHALSHWCWYTCERDTLAASMAATNYAIEGATGEWCLLVCSSDVYENMFEANERKKAMKWLKIHAQYDDTHPWEALEIICTLMGENPTARGVALLQSSIRKSYEYLRVSLDHCLLMQMADGRQVFPVPPVERMELKRA
jgi:pyrroloquinoline quinone (PQQ) biosynthesis protein C